MGIVNGSHSARTSPDLILSLSLKFSLQPKGSLCLALSLLFESKIEIVEFLDRFIRFPLLSFEAFKLSYFVTLIILLIILHYYKNYLECTLSYQYLRSLKYLITCKKYLSYIIY